MARLGSPIVPVPDHPGDDARSKLRVLVPAVAAMPTDDVGRVEGAVPAAAASGWLDEAPRHGGVVLDDGVMAGSAVRPGVVEREARWPVAPDAPRPHPMTALAAPAAFPGVEMVPRNVRRSW